MCLDARVTERSGHIPVLLDEVLALLEPGGRDVVLDCTAGLGGHAGALAARLGPGGVVVVNDADAANAASAASRVRAEAPAGVEVHEVVGNFVAAPRVLGGMGLRASVVLADLGFASNQMADPERGLSFQADGPLDMRYGRSEKREARSGKPDREVGEAGRDDRARGGMAGAAELVNGLPEAELAGLLRELGEERRAGAIARKIVAARESEPIETTGRLAALVVEAIGPRGGGPRVHPATRTFQALRIAVNDELGSLGLLLESVERGAALAGTGGAGTGAGSVGGSGGGSGGGIRGGWLAAGARVGVISFHSLEDRLVKRGFGELVRRGLAAHRTRRPAEASASEASANPRSRSAKLRVVRLVGGEGGGGR